MQPLRISKARGVVVGLILAGAVLGACSDTPSGPVTQPGPETVQVSYCTGLEPEWVAFQDGDGPWTRATPTATGGTTTFQYTFQTSRGGIARIARGGNGLTALEVLYGARAELATAGETKAIFCGDPVSKALLGTVVGLDTNEAAVVGGGLSRIVAIPATGGHLALNGLPSGPRDLIVARATRANGRTAVTSFIVRRDVDLPDSTTLPVFDFGSSEAFPPATATLTINGMSSEGASVGVRLLTGTTEVLFSPVVSASLDVARPYSALPTAQLRPGDLQEVFVSAVASTASRSAQLYFRSPSDLTLAIPAPLVRPTFATVATTPALRLAARFVPQGDYDRTASISYQQGTTRIVGVTMTAAYASAVGGYELTVPDLSAVTGFDPTWALHTGLPLLWTAGRVGGTLGLGVSVMPSDGATRRDAFDMDSIPGS